VVNYRERQSTKNAIFTEILNGIVGSNNKVALGSATINITEVPTIDIVNKETSLNQH
jgi:hypothetical protein